MTDKLILGHQEDAKKIVEFVGSVKPEVIMTDKDRKLAEEILSKKWIPQFNKAGVATGRYIVFDNDAIEALNTYHSAKMQEVTDGDIIEWACYGYDESVGMDEITEGRIEGAKAMRNGGIKRIEKEDKSISIDQYTNMNPDIENLGWPYDGTDDGDR